MSIFKLGGPDKNFKRSVATVKFNDINNNLLEIVGNGCFLLLPTMLSEDLFALREKVPLEYTGKPNIKKETSFLPHNSNDNYVTLDNYNSLASF